MILHLLVILYSIHSAFSQFTLSILPANQPIILGQKVTLRCQIKGLNFPMKYAVLFKRKDKLISEKCQVYEKNKYELKCEPNDWQRAHTFELLIKSVSWSDRGPWSCIYAANLTEKSLDIYAPAILEKMGVTNPVSNMGTVDIAKSPLMGMNSDLSILRNQISQHVGLGTRTNPYDLRSGLSLELKCETNCGYPQANITWLLRNETMVRSVASSENMVNEVSYARCNGSPQTAEMTTTTSRLKVSCVQLELIGLNQVECTVNGPQYKKLSLTRHVYILCADKYEKFSLDKRKQDIVSHSGERPMKLTSGEVVGIAVGAALALILTFVGCIVLRNGNKDSPIAFPAYAPGQRV